MLDNIVLGLVEGITEFLPISSTGHLLVAEHLLGSQKSDAFNVLIQVGPIFAAIVVFWKHIVDLATGLGDPEKRDEVIKLVASFILTGIGGLAMKKLGLKLPETVLPIALATFVGGLLILWVEKKSGKATTTRIGWNVAIAVAGAQLLAAGFPGTSRSGAAVMMALAFGLARPEAVRFAFLVGIPTMLAAGGKQILDAVKSGQSAELTALGTLVAFAVATLSAFLAVKWLLKFVQTRDFVPFAWYRLAMGAALLLTWGLGWMK